jgi:hypothetical protein
MAEQLWPEMASKLSAAHRMQVRRRRKRWMIGTGLAVAAAVTGATLLAVFQSSGPLQVQSSVGHEFSIDHTFAMTVLNAPQCSKGACNVEVRFRNVSNYSTSIGYGSFTDPQFATTSGLCDPSPLVGCTGPSYVVSLIGNGNYYDSINGTFSANYLLPKQVVTADFSFQVPGRTAIQELKLSNLFGDAFVGFPNS